MQARRNVPWASYKNFWAAWAPPCFLFFIQWFWDDRQNRFFWGLRLDVGYQICAGPRCWSFFMALGGRGDQWQDELTIVWMEFLSTSTRFVSTSGPANMASAGSCCRTWHAAGHKSLWRKNRRILKTEKETSHQASQSNPDNSTQSLIAVSVLWLSITGGIHPTYQAQRQCMIGLQPARRSRKLLKNRATMLPWFSLHYQVLTGSRRDDGRMAR